MSTTEWTILEKLLLSQAVYKYGEDNWFQIARNLKHHALLDCPSDYFNQKNCSLQYYLMIEDMDKEKRQQQSLTTQDMPVVVRLARQLYTQRLEELKKEISEDEEKFLALVSEIEEIRAGKWDDQLLKNSKEDIKKEDQSEKHLSESLETQETQEINASNDEKKTEEMTVVESENKQNEEITQSTDREQLGEKDINDNREQQLAIDNDVDQASNVDVSVQPEQEKQTNNVEQSLQSSTELDASQQPQQEESPKAKPETVDEPESEPPEIRDTSNGRDTVVSAEEPTSILEPNTEESSRMAQKRQAEDIATSEEFQLKRSRLDNREEANAESEIENEPLNADTTKTEYSTDLDVSQGTTPAEMDYTKDGEESGAGESNAPTPTNERSGSHSKKLSKEDPRHKSWLKNINLLWREIANHKNGTMFMNPIKESIAPQYYDIVKKPMDLKTIKNRIRDGLINTTTEFERDVILMLTNSLMYNTEGTEVYQMAKEMLDDATEQIRIFKTADEDTSASTHTRAASMAAKERKKSLANE
ncbi:unnamed protein product [Rhizopus microsporus]